jgi:type I restriction enzyme S subunit
MLGALSKDGTIGRTVVVKEDREFAVASSLIILRPEPTWVDAEFLNFLCQSRFVSNQVECFVKGAGLPRLSIQNLVKVVGCFPPLPEQAYITAFLERETAKIDMLVVEQQRLIELLKEKRQAVISHAVTKGLNPDAPMKDSGIEWLGEIPSHWEWAALLRISSRVVVGIAEAATHAYADEGVPILRSTNIRAGRITGEILFVDPAFASERGTKRLYAGDLVSVRTGNAGVTATIPAHLDGCQCFTMLITTLNVGSVSEYYCYWMNSISAQCYFSLEGWGTAQVNISVPILKSLPVPLPPQAEQQAIVAALDRETAKIDTLTTEAQRAIDLLQERRTALISAAVTGQIDVRPAAERASA